MLYLSITQDPANTLGAGEKAPERRSGSTKERRRRSEDAQAQPVSGAGSVRGLGNTRIAFHPELTRRKRRAERHEAREQLRAHTSLERVRKCGHTPVQNGGVAVRRTETAQGVRAGFAGLATCGSVWACPVCAAKVAAQRSADLSSVLTVARSRGYSVALMTFTVRHNRAHSLKSVWDAVQAGWHRVTGGKAWASDKGVHEVQGWAKAVEVTHGSNGWHVHIHVAVVFKGGQETAGRLGNRMWNRWQAGIESAGFTALQNSGGLDVTLASGSGAQTGALGAYFAKQTDYLAQEMTLGSLKAGRRENRTPFQLLASLFATGDEADLKLWHEWEAGSRGRRQLTWSKGLREWAGLGQELTDEEAATAELGTAEDNLVLLPGPTWRKVRERAWLLLDITEKHGKQGLTNWLDKQGLTWENITVSRE